MSILSLPITITLAAVGILVLAIGLSFTIHVIIGFEKYLNQDMSVREALINAMKDLHIAIIASFITTLAGFTALMFGVSPSSQSQGLVLSLAIIIIFLVTFILLPCLLYIFGYKHKPSKIPLFERIKFELARLAKYQARFPKTVLFFIGGVTIFMVIGASQVGFDTGNDNWIPDDDEIQESFRESSYAFGNDFSSIDLVLESTRGDLRNIDTVQDINRLSSVLQSHPDIESVSNPFDDVDITRSQIHAHVLQVSEQFNKDYTLTTMRVSVADFETDEGGSSEVLEEIQGVVSENPVSDVKISYYGDTIRFSELGESLGRDTGVTTMISFVLVFLIATLTYFSFKVGIIAISPIVISIIWTVGIMGYTGVPFTALSTGLIALVLGIGIDFSIHLVNSSFNYLNRGYSLDLALENTLSYSGSALLLTTITTFIGFISLLLATLLGIQRLGLALAFSIVSAFLVTIILVPAIISLSYKEKNDFEKN